MSNSNLTPKALIKFKSGEKFRISISGDVCKVLNKYDLPRIEIYNERKKTREVFRGTSWVIPILNT